MIFVTVGTHEQPFNRLIEAIDELKADHTIPESEQVFIQTGFSTYTPKHCSYATLVPAEQMKQLMRDASIVVTHGGPSTFIEAMAAGNTPVVVPRRSEFGEHVNDHQVDFVRQVEKTYDGIIPVYDVADLPKALAKAKESAGNAAFHSHNSEFCKQLASLVSEIQH